MQPSRPCGPQRYTVCWRSLHRLGVRSIQPSSVRSGIAAALAVLCLAAPAAAHSELRSTVPASGARLAQSPASLQLTFNEDVQVTALRLLDADDRPVRVERAAGRDAQRSAQALVPPLAPGPYRVLWAAISADGHPIAGSFRFEVLGAAAGAASGERPARAVPGRTEAR